MNLDLNQEINVEIKRLGINGEGIAYYQKLAIFVNHAIPGETVKIKITKVEPKYAMGEIITILKKSEKRISPFCPHYDRCGGCTLQHIRYEATGEYKRDLIVQALERYTTLNVRSFEIKKTILMEDPYSYRAKSSLPYRQFTNQAVFGIFETNSNIIVPIDSCPIQHDVVNKINTFVLNKINQYKIPCFNNKTKEGIIKMVVTRISLKSGQAQVTFILNEPYNLKSLANDLMKLDEVVSVFQSLNNKPDANHIFGEKIEKLAGEDVIIERLSSFDYRLYPASFFQLNPTQTVKLYDEVKKACKLSMKEIVIDAYCGAGAIGIYLAKQAKEVIGIEINHDSIENAKENAKLNKIKNITFLEGDTTTLLPTVLKEKNADILVVDPPRTGLTKELKDAINKHKPNKIVYVSCNPSTLAKDISEIEQNYQVKYIQPLDMFPWTAHVETVVLLYRR